MKASFGILLAALEHIWRPAGQQTEERTMRRELSERKRSRLALTHPRLNPAPSDARKVKRLQEDLALMSRGLETLACGVIIVTATGRIRWVTGRARQWATDYLRSSLRDGDRLPEAVDQWMRRARAGLEPADGIALPAAPLILEREGRRLSVRLVASAEHILLLLLEERRDTVVIEPLKRMGLSRREVEVLTWVTRGKSNADVGRILSVSARTVEKHLERVYQKLGVENRTAAVAVALEPSAV